MSRKVEFLNSVSIGTMCGFKSYNKMFEMQSFGLDTGPQSVLLLVYCPVDNTLFEVGRKIRCSCVSSHYCCYADYAAGSEPI